MERMTLAKWYGNSVEIPVAGSWRFVDFVISSMGIVSSIVREEMSKKISIRFMAGGTALADWDHHIIHINEDYLHGKVGADIPQLTGDETLVNLLGIQVHEAAHFAYSPTTLLPFAQYVKDKTKCAYYEEVAQTIGNLVEDIYIEAEVDREVPSLTWMLQGTNEIFFSQFAEQKVLKKAEDIVGSPQNLLQVSYAINVLLLAKTRNLIETTPYLQDLFQTALTGKETQYLSSRCELTLALYNALMAEITQAECDAAKKAKEDAEKTGAGKVAADAIEDSKRRSEGMTASHTNRTGKTQTVKTVTTDISREVEKALEEFEERTIKLVDLKDELEGSTHLFTEKIVEAAEPLAFDKRYSKLAEFARQNAVVNRPYGLDRNRGHSIRKLYRIATDQKIFAEPAPMSSFKPMEVIILVDCSGSMGQPDAFGISRITKAARAAGGAAEALVEGRCMVAVYGHTADQITENECNILLLKGFMEDIPVLSSRLGGLLKNERKRENRDGYAIDYVSKKFSMSNRHKLLIVISDGEPAANHYHGRSANVQTQTIVNQVRQKGIDVLSISITEEANKANKFIYGNTKNVYNQDPNVIAEIVRSLIVQ